MIRLTRYLKPYLLMILLAVVLLFVQANAELALPDYLSRIVNVGLQQGGVESTLPSAIRQRTVERLALFLNDADQATLLAQYTLVDRASPDYDTWVKQYPTLAQESVYVAGEVDKAAVEALKPALNQAWLAVAAIEQAMADPARAAEMGGLGDFDISRLPAGTDLFAVLAQLPAAQRMQMMTRMQAQLAALDERMVEQAAIQAVKAEYIALGVSAENLQTAYILRIGGLMLLLTLLLGVCTIAVGFLAARVSAGLGRDLRKAVFEKVERFSNTEFDKFSTASLITRTTNDVLQ